MNWPYSFMLGMASVSAGLSWLSHRWMKRRDERSFAEEEARHEASRGVFDMYPGLIWVIGPETVRLEVPRFHDRDGNHQ